MGNNKGAALLWALERASDYVFIDINYHTNDHLAISDMVPNELDFCKSKILYKPYSTNYHYNELTGNYTAEIGIGSFLSFRAPSPQCYVDYIECVKEAKKVVATMKKEWRARL
jgi:hypothetical protein